VYEKRFSSSHAPSVLAGLAQGLSSASNPDVAAWQERGILEPWSRHGLAVWGALCLSAAIGLGCAVIAWYRTWVALAVLDRPLPPHSSRLADPFILLILAFLVVLVLACAVAFGCFQILCRVAFAIRRRGDL
jgi:hypothetical protein